MPWPFGLGSSLIRAAVISGAGSNGGVERPAAGDPGLPGVFRFGEVPGVAGWIAQIDRERDVNHRFTGSGQNY